MDDNEHYLAGTLRCLLHLALDDQPTFNTLTPTSRARVLRAIPDVALAAEPHGGLLDGHQRIQLDRLLRETYSARDPRRSTHERLTVAFVCLNPFLLPVPVIARLLPGYTITTVGNIRTKVRAMATHNNSVGPDAHTRKGRKIPEPLHPDTGLYYGELNDRGGTVVGHAGHVAQPRSYLFHAQAWARREYAGQLIALGEPACPYTGATPDALDRDNPTQGDGWLHLRLAAMYLGARPGKDLYLPRGDQRGSIQIKHLDMYRHIEQGLASFGYDNKIIPRWMRHGAVLYRKLAGEPEE